MTRRRLIAAIALTVMMQSGPAIAANKNCASIDAMLAPGDKSLRELSLKINRWGTLELQRNGKADIFKDMDTCTFYTGDGEFELDCDWTFGNLAEANGRYLLLKQQLAPCLPGELRDISTPSSISTMVSHRHDVLDVKDDNGEYDGASLSLTLFEHSRETGNNVFYLGLSISR